MDKINGKSRLTDEDGTPLALEREHEEPSLTDEEVEAIYRLIVKPYLDIEKETLTIKAHVDYSR